MKSLLILGLLCSVALAADAPPVVPLKLPKEVKGFTHTPIRIVAETSSPKVRWKCFDPKLTLVDREDLADTKKQIVVGCKPGKYTLYCWGTSEEGKDVTDLAPVVVTLEDNPDIVPTPPDPGPTPVPPKPDALVATFKDAYKLAGPNQAEALAALTNVWSAAVGICDRAEVTTVDDLVTVVMNSAKNNTFGGLVDLRRAIATHLQTVLPFEEGTALTKEIRDRCKLEFTRVAKALEAIK